VSQYKRILAFMFVSMHQSTLFAMAHESAPDSWRVSLGCVSRPCFCRFQVEKQHG
jgi:hypothetical protein